MGCINRNVYDDTLFHRCMAIQQKGEKCKKYQPVITTVLSS